ncbi:hypothetical protein Tco_0087809 [Tanacetum coccineum]
MILLNAGDQYGVFIPTGEKIRRNNGNEKKWEKDPYNISENGFTRRKLKSGRDKSEVVVGPPLNSLFQIKHKVSDSEQRINQSVLFPPRKCMKCGGQNLLSQQQEDGTGLSFNASILATRRLTFKQFFTKGIVFVKRISSLNPSNFLE